jgi:hypothetical protein
MDECLKSCSGVVVFAGTGNKYVAGPCGISDGTFGNASKISRSNEISSFDDAEIGVIERSDPGDSGMMGGSMGDCSGIASSGHAHSRSDLLECD